MNYHVEESNLAITGIPTALKEIWGKEHNHATLERIAHSVCLRAIPPHDLDGGHLRESRHQATRALPEAIPVRRHRRFVRGIRAFRDEVIIA